MKININRLIAPNNNFSTAVVHSGFINMSFPKLSTLWAGFVFRKPVFGVWATFVS